MSISQLAVIAATAISAYAFFACGMNLMNAYDDYGPAMYGMSFLSITIGLGVFRVLGGSREPKTN